MAFQGKGILGGFSGKIGALMGYNRKGKSIIQSIGKTGSSSKGFGFVNRLLLMSPLGNGTTGLGFIKNVMSGHDATLGGFSEQQLSGNKGGWSYKVPDNTAFKLIFISNTIGELDIAASLITVAHTSARVRVFVNGSTVLNLPTGVPNESFRIYWDNNQLGFYTDSNTGVFSLKYTFVNVDVSKSYFSANVRTTNSELIEISMLKVWRL